jgi:hypothetical protein
MRKSSFLLLFALCTLLTACKKEHISFCTDPECETYLAVWEKRTLQNSSLSQAYLDEHFFAHQTRISHGPQGIVFGVEFKVTIDWAEVEGYDGFYINLHADDTVFTNPMMPHEVYLSEADILQAMVDYPEEYAAPFFAPIEELLYDTKGDAMKVLRKDTDQAVHYQRVFFPLGGFAGLPNNGHPYLLTTIGGEETVGSRTFKILDLTTGEITDYQE